MRVLWVCFALASFYWISAVPALCQEDFTTHNRFIMGKQYWPKDPDHFPRVHAPEHSVRTGEVVTRGQSIDPSLFLKPVPQFSPATSSVFGQPRSVAPLPPPQSSVPLPIVIARPDPASPIKPTLPLLAVSQDLAPPKPKSARQIVTVRKQTKALLVAHEPPSLKTASYPKNTGYTYSDSLEVSASSDSARTTVHAKLLPLH
jgi:hypothetical protein